MGIFSFLNAKTQSEDEKGVVINGVKWATRNVAAPGTFAAKPKDSGMFYQWNRKKAWPATDEITNWDNSCPTGDTWEKTNDPSPVGWRVPTLVEIEKLLNTKKVSNVWTTLKGVKGRKFTDRITGNSLFLPAANKRDSDGTLCDDKNTWDCEGRGDYWSSTMNLDDTAYGLNIQSCGTGEKYFGSRHYGFCVRPVAE